MALVEHRSPLIEALDPTPLPTIDAPAPVAHNRGLKVAPKPTHPDCDGCCALRRCHWCLGPSKATPYGDDGYVMLQWHDGYFYGACLDHARYLRAAIAGELSPDVQIAGAV